MTRDPNKLIADIVERAPFVRLAAPVPPPPDIADEYDDASPPEPPLDDGADSATLAACSQLEQNDTDNGRRLLMHFGADLLHVREVGIFGWADTHWRRDGGDEAAVRFAQRTAKRIHLEADHLALTPSERRTIEAAEPALAKPEADRSADDKRLIAAGDNAREALTRRRIGRRKFAVSSGNGARISSMITQAVPHKSVAPDELDSDPLLLNTLDCTLRFVREEDLECPDPGEKRFRLRVDRIPHDRSHLITKMAPVVYDPSASCPHWLAFLDRFQPKLAVRRFLQAYHGLALTGLMGEQCLLYNHGTGANGKSTFMEAVSALMGDYADLLNAESLTGQGQRRGDQATPDFADLPGARYLRISELPRGEPLKEALVKSLTGGEQIKARHLNKGFFKFWPVFKASMSGNDLPSIGGVDHGIWRRIRLVPWEVTIPDEERRAMSEVLAEFEGERSGILNWLIEGLAIYVAEGLRAPAEVLAATAAYREEMDPIGEFVGGCVERIEGASVTAREMYQAFESWCLANGVRAWKETAFGRAMPLKGYTKTNERIRRYLDVALHDVPPRPEPPRSPQDGDYGR